MNVKMPTRLVRFHAGASPVSIDPEIVAEYNQVSSEALVEECGSFYRPLYLDDDGRIVWLGLDCGNFGKLEVPLIHAGKSKVWPSIAKEDAVYLLCRRYLRPLIQQDDWEQHPEILRITSQWMRDNGWTEEKCRDLFDRPWQFQEEIHAAIAETCLMTANPPQTQER